MAVNSVPQSWADADQIEGLDLVDKDTLVDVPFLITGCAFKVVENKRYCYVDVELVTGDRIMFQDSSSTGIQFQLINYLKSKELDHVIDTEEPVNFRLVAPKGLRVSEYDRTDAEALRMVQRGGKPPRGKTFYLTTNGIRLGASNAGKPAPATRSPRKAATAS